MINLRFKVHILKVYLKTTHNTKKIIMNIVLTIFLFLRRIYYDDDDE